MNKCYFSDETLDSETHEEHTIPRSIGGRIRSFRVSSSRFNKRSGDRVDSYLAGIYAEVMQVLGPMLNSESRSASKQFRIPGQEGWWQIDDRGRLCLASVVVDRDPLSKLPKSAYAANAHQLRNITKQATSKGLNVQFHKERLPKNMEVMHPKRAIMDWRVDIALIKAILLSFEERLIDDPYRFTRSKILEPVRRFVREIVESTSETPDVSFLAELTLGLQYEPDYLARYTRLRKDARLTVTPFQHTLIVSANSSSRTLDALFWAFDADPHAFRLTNEWKDKAFTYVLTNGILSNTRPSDAVLLHDSQMLGKPNCRRCVRMVDVLPSDAEKFSIGDEIVAQRFGLYRQAVDYVERHCDEFVREQLSLLARLEPGTDHRLTTALISRLATLYAAVTKTDIGAGKFVELIAPIIDNAGDSKLIADSFEEAVPEEGWDYWLRTYRNCLDELRSRFGLPGYIFRS